MVECTAAKYYSTDGFHEMSVFHPLTSEILLWAQCPDLDCDEYIIREVLSGCRYNLKSRYSSAVKTLPASWYCSKNLYELEKRAVFLNAWFLLGPTPRYEKNEETEYELAGVIVRVFKQEDGTFLVRRKSDSLPLLSHLTPTGLLFTTISPSAPPFHIYFPNLEPLLNAYDFTRLPHRRSISYPGAFNWKTMVDGYQECLHCQYTHRSFSVLYPPTFYEVHNNGNYSRHIADPAKFDDGLFLYFFPNCTLNLYGGGMSSFRVCPLAEPGMTRMEFDYYHESEGEKFEEYFQFVRRVAMEDFELCEVAQSNLEKGVYVQGVLNGVKEGGVLHYQQQVRRLVVEKFKEEEAERANSCGAADEGCGPGVVRAKSVAASA